MARDTVDKTDLEQLEWLVKHRSENQQTSLKLYSLHQELHEGGEADPSLASLGITLTAVSFSLWRAVFLCEAGTLSAQRRFEDATAFLETVIADNAISYVQDKRSKEWTAVYYLNNARFRLESLSRLNPEIRPSYKDPDYTAMTAMWEYLQSALDAAVSNYAKQLKAHKKKGRKA